jgi:Ca2+-binding RTX toxin-like protein
MMFGNFSQQMKNSTKPVSTLLEINTKALQTMSKQHSVFFSGVMTDSVKLMTALAGQSELKGVIAAQSVYAASLKERFTSTSTATFGALSAMGNEAASVIKDSTESTVADSQNTGDTVSAATAKTAGQAKTSAAKKTTSKKQDAKGSQSISKKAPAASADKTASDNLQPAEKTASSQKTPPVVAEKAVDKAAAADTKITKAPAKKAVVKKAASSTTAAPTTAKPSKATADKVAAKKTVADLSPADVKADSAKTA